MSTVARRRSSQQKDAVVDPPVVLGLGCVATLLKRRLRSDSNCEGVSPLRKSPRLCNQEGCDSPPKVEEIEKSLKCSLDFSKSPPLEERMTENVKEKPIWDPKDLDQVRAVKEALHVSTAPTNVICREVEQRRILDFFKQCVHQERAGSLYICGRPGTGKSLSMEKVKEALVDWANKEAVESLDILSLNCTSLTSTIEIFSKILEHNYPQKKPNRSKSPLQILHHIYSQKQSASMKMTLIIADELDYLITKDRAVLHDLFMLTTMPFSKCILLGVANAIDLADKFMPKLQSLNCKPMVITFRAYSKDQIKTILQQGLGELPYIVFQPQAVELYARKVSSSSGDMRKALSVCRSAIEMFEAEKRDAVCNSSFSLSERTGDQQDPTPCDTTDKTNNMVRIDHVVAALSKAFKSPVVDTIQSLPQHQQMILCSAVKFFRGRKKETTLGELNKYYADVCKSISIPPVGIMELSSMCRVLDDQGILKLGQSKDDKLRRVTLKVGEADVVFALQIGDQFPSNDAGEPSGTAGKPIHSAIESSGIDRVMVVVIRYFGGINLGNGGLVKAYGGVAAECLENAPTCVVKSKLQSFQVENIKQDYDSTGKDNAVMVTFKVDFDRAESLEEAIKVNCSRDIVFYRR